MLMWLNSSISKGKTQEMAQISLQDLNLVQDHMVSMAKEVDLLEVAETHQIDHNVKFVEKLVTLLWIAITYLTLSLVPNQVQKMPNLRILHNMTIQD